jgi:fructose-1,6-bisphosphatase/inositol monophosphatase family enzyme
MTSLNRKNLKAWLGEAVSMADRSRELILESVRTGFEHTLKDDGTFVTDVDTSVETALRARILESFPEHGIIGEELNDVNPDADFVWTIDPIDGTQSFRHRIPLYGTIISLLHHDIPVLGVIDLPALGIRCSGALGEGAFCGDEQLRIEDLGDDQAIEREIIAAGERKQFVGIGKEYVFDEIMHAHPSVRTYCDCFGHVMALLGSVGAMVDFNLHVWDSAATEVLVKEAGGKHVRLFEDRRGGRDVRYDVVFGKPRVVDWLLERIR